MTELAEQQTAERQATQLTRDVARDEHRPVQRLRRRSRFAERSLVRNPLPAIAAAITVFLVALALLIARLSAGHDPALRQSAAAPAVTTAAGGSRRVVVRTTASGRSILTTAAGGGEAVNGHAGTGSGAGYAPLLTRSSGGGRRDD